MSASKKAQRQLEHRKNGHLLDAIVYQLINDHKLTADDVSSEYARQARSQHQKLQVGPDN